MFGLLTSRKQKILKALDEVNNYIAFINDTLKEESTKYGFVGSSGCDYSGVGMIERTVLNKYYGIDKDDMNSSELELVLDILLSKDDVLMVSFYNEKTEVVSKCHSFINRKTAMGYEPKGYLVKLEVESLCRRLKHYIETQGDTNEN